MYVYVYIYIYILHNEGLLGNMGLMKLMVLLLVLFNITFHALAVAASNLYSDESNSYATSGNNGVVNQSKFAHAGARGGGGGASAGEGMHGNGGQANSSPRGGGALPVYAAGSGAAANRNNNHHGAAGICSHCRKDGLMIFVSTTLILLLLHVFL